jgi:gamma-glutamylputrescine oxidase
MDILTANDRPGEYPSSSYYVATSHPALAFPQAEGELRCDVCVVGGGYMGLSTALHLAERGLDVVLLEAHRVGWGASGRNGGQVNIGQRLDQFELGRWPASSGPRRCGSWQATRWRWSKP